MMSPGPFCLPFALQDAHEAAQPEGMQLALPNQPESYQEPERWTDQSDFEHDGHNKRQQRMARGSSHHR